MGELIRTYAWHKTTLGEPASWPQSLKTSVRLLLSSGHPMFIWWGPDLIQFYNDAYTRSIGLAKRFSALGQNGRECWSEMWELIGPQIELVMSGKGATWHANQLVPITRKNGRRVAVYWTYSYSPIDEPSSATGVGGVLVICTETTAQVMEERRKKAAELRWRELFNQSPGFMCILSGPEHRFEFANPRYLELLGGRELIGKTIREALPEVSNQAYVELLDEAFRNGKAVSGVATPLTLARLGSNVQYLYIDFVYQPIFDSKGEVTGIFVNGYDVTESIHVTEILTQESHRKDEFLAMLSHELRNPLAPIANAAELLIQSPASLPYVRDAADIVKRQVRQLRYLVDELLDTSSIVSGKIELKKEPLRLDSLIKCAIESVQHLLVEQQQEIVCAADEYGLYIEGDSARLIQCFTNVLANASKFSHVGGLIHLELRRVDQIAVIDIADDGAGISSEMQPIFFERIVKDGRIAEEPSSGSGMGLAVARRVVELHGGQITAISAGVGQGSRFEICLPVMVLPAQISVSIPVSLNSSLMRK